MSPRCLPYFNLHFQQYPLQAACLPGHTTQRFAGLANPSRAADAEASAASSHHRNFVSPIFLGLCGAHAVRGQEVFLMARWYLVAVVEPEQSGVWSWLPHQATGQCQGAGIPGQKIKEN